MEKATLLATVIVIGAAVIWGFPGVIWVHVFAVPLGCVLWVIAKLLKWM